MTAARWPRKACRKKFSSQPRPWSRVPLSEYQAKHRTHEVVRRASSKNLLFAVFNGHLWPGRGHSAWQRDENGRRSSCVDAERDLPFFSPRLLLPHRVAWNWLPVDLFDLLYPCAFVGGF